jgi:hypothetical protein
MTHEVSCQPLTSESHGESQGISCADFGEQSSIKRNSIQVGRLPSDSVISQILHSPLIHPLTD